MVLARLWLLAGALAGGSGVAMSAVAAHALPQRLDAKALSSVQSAIVMQGWHAAALLITGLIVLRGGDAVAQAAGAAFLAGLVLFCGAVYAGALGGVHLGPVAPAGGMLLMLGWLLLAIAALRV